MTSRSGVNWYLNFQFPHHVQLYPCVSEPVQPAEHSDVFATRARSSGNAYSGDSVLFKMPDDIAVDHVDHVFGDIDRAMSAMRPRLFGHGVQLQQPGDPSVGHLPAIGGPNLLVRISALRRSTCRRCRVETRRPGLTSTQRFQTVSEHRLGPFSTLSEMPRRHVRRGPVSRQGTTRLGDIGRQVAGASRSLLIFSTAMTNRRWPAAGW